MDDQNDFQDLLEQVEGGFQRRGLAVADRTHCIVRDHLFLQELPQVDHDAGSGRVVRGSLVEIQPSQVRNVLPQRTRPSVMSQTRGIDASLLRGTRRAECRILARLP